MFDISGEASSGDLPSSLHVNVNDLVEFIFIFRDHCRQSEDIRV